MARTSQPGRSVSSKLLAILFAFDSRHTRLTLSELVRRTDMPHATVRRLALELVASGALVRDEGGEYSVGLRLWQLGTLAPGTESMRTLMQPFAEDLNAALRQHVQLAVLDGREAVIIERYSAPNAPELLGRVGSRVPLHATAVGKMLLAHADEGLIAEVLESKLERYTAQTTVDSLELRRELALCRSHGTARVEGELTTNADSVATRVVDGRGRVVAALSVVVSAGSQSLDAVLPSVVASGFGMSRRLGWHPGVPVRRIM